MAIECCKIFNKFFILNENNSFSPGTFETGEARDIVATVMTNQGTTACVINGQFVLKPGMSFNFCNPGCLDTSVYSLRFESNVYVNDGQVAIVGVLPRNEICLTLAVKVK